MLPRRSDRQITARGPANGPSCTFVRSRRRTAFRRLARFGSSTRADSLEHLPIGLRHEITHAQDFAPVASVIVGGRPVSFCYPVWRTERFWDVSIDTLEEHRGRSLAVQAVSFMIDLMRREGREPVWGALASNRPSLRLGEKLGFKPVDEIVVFSTGGWVFLSGGFTGA